LVYLKCLDFIRQETQKIVRKGNKAPAVEVKHSTLLGSPDLRNELIDENNFNSTVTNKVGATLPELEIVVGKVKIKCIVDTGSQATLISEEIYANIKSQQNIDIPELPVTNVSIMGVTGVKSKKIHKQVLLPCNIGNRMFDIACFVVRGIPATAIIGSDFFEKYEATINYRDYTIELRESDRRHVVNLIRSNNEEHVCSVKIIYGRHVRLVSDDEQIEAEVKVNNVQVKHNKIGEVINDIKGRNNEICTQHLDDLTVVLHKHQEIFSDKPGLIKDFEAKIALTNDEPFIGRAYPIPFHKKKEVQKG
jgi:hypothetical protein